MKKIVVLFFFCCLPNIVFSNSEIDKAVKKAAKQSWHQAKTPNFTIVTDRGEKFAFKLAEDLEKFRAVYFLLSGKKSETKKRIKVLATKNKPIFKVFFSNPDDIGYTVGFFRQAKGNNYAIIDVTRNSFKRSSKVLFATYSFYITANYSKYKMPYWFRQGLAYYLGELKFKGEKNALLGFPNNEYLMTLHEGPLIPLEQLLGATSKTDFKGMSERKFPAQVWLLTHYLYSDANRTKQLHKYLSLKRQGASDHDAIKEAFAMTISELERELKRYLKNRRVLYFKVHIDRKVERELQKYVNNKDSSQTKISTANLEFDGDITVSKILSQDALNFIGEVLALEARRYSDADYVFESVLQSDPSNVVALARKSELFIESDLSKAKSILEMARKVNPNDPSVAKASGVIYKIEMEQAQTPELKKELWNKAVRNLNKAINAEDMDLEALYYGAKMYMEKQRWQKASELLDVALFYAPNETDFQLEQIICLYQLSKKEEAEAEYQRLMANLSASKSTTKHINKIMDCLRNQNCD